MGTEQDLIQKLMISKKIMEKHNEMGRGQLPTGNYNVNVDNFEPIQGNYNIPQEFMAEQQAPTTTYSNEIPTKDRILNSKLPDEIKRLMIEHPINQPQQQQQTTLSDDLIERASRLMKSGTNNYTPESAKSKPVLKESSNLDMSKIQQMIEDAVERALEKNGMIVESVEKTGELFSFKVGKHIFEGKVTKIKKLS